MLFINYAAAPHPNPRDRGRYFLALAIQAELRRRCATDRVTAGPCFHPHWGFMVYFCRCLARQDGLDGSESGGCEGKMEEGGELKFRRTVFSRVAES